MRNALKETFIFLQQHRKKSNRKVWGKKKPTEPNYRAGFLFLLGWKNEKVRLLKF